LPPPNKSEKKMTFPKIVAKYIILSCETSRLLASRGFDFVSRSLPGYTSIKHQIPSPSKKYQYSFGSNVLTVTLADTGELQVYLVDKARFLASKGTTCLTPPLYEPRTSEFDYENGAPEELANKIEVMATELHAEWHEARQSPDFLRITRATVLLNKRGSFSFAIYSGTEDYLYMLYQSSSKGTSLDFGDKCLGILIDNDQNAQVFAYSADEHRRLSSSYRVPQQLHTPFTLSLKGSGYVAVAKKLEALLSEMYGIDMISGLETVL